VWNKTNVDFESLGAQELKNIEAPMEVFRAVLPWEEYEKEEAKTPEGTRLAVLPLANISPDPDDAYFTDGLTEELIFTLSRIPKLKVIAQTSVMPYNGRTVPIRQIGGEPKVGSVLEGSVRKSGDRVRITLQLIDVGTEKHLWSERYDRQLEDIFEIQDSIAEEVAARLRTLLAVAPAPTEKKPTESIEAYDVYLRGRKWFQQEGEDALRKAIEFFEQALALDPGFAAAHASLARSSARLFHRGYVTPDEVPTIERRAFEAARRAIALAPNLDEAHTRRSESVTGHCEGTTSRRRKSSEPLSS